jgi:hypothetical protein
MERPSVKGVRFKLDNENGTNFNSNDSNSQSVRSCAYSESVEEPKAPSCSRWRFGRPALDFWRRIVGCADGDDVVDAETIWGVSLKRHRLAMGAVRWPEAELAGVSIVVSLLDFIIMEQ